MLFKSGKHGLGTSSVSSPRAVVVFQLCAGTSIKQTFSLLFRFEYLLLVDMSNTGVPNGLLYAQATSDPNGFY